MTINLVMPGLDPGIDVFGHVEGSRGWPDKPGQDGVVCHSSSIGWYLPFSSIAVPQTLCEAWCSARP